MTGSVEPIVCSWRQQFRSFSDDQDFSALEKEAKQYFDSKQHAHDWASDIGLHGQLRSILDGMRLSGGLGYLRSRVDHRTNQIMGTATLYKDFLGIAYPGCHEVNVEEFRHGKDGYKRYSEIESLICTYLLFDSRFIHPYLKGRHYLVQCIFRQPWSKSEIIARLDSLVKYRGEPVSSLYTL